MRVAVLGDAQAWLPEDAAGDGPDAATGLVAVDLGTRKQRALLAVLALHGGRPVSVDSIIDAIWGQAPPPSVTGTLQVYVAGLRRALEPHRVARSRSTVLVTREAGYALVLPAGALDTEEFARVVGSVHEAVDRIDLLDQPAGWRPSEAELRACADRLDGALSLWRGTPYAELGDAPDAEVDRTRLEELRVLALEDRAVVALALGRHAAVAPELEVLTRAHPLRERMWALRALALARSGRQSDALAALREVRALLDDELGLQPGPALQRLQVALLRQDPALDWTPPPAPDPAPSAPPAPSPSAPPAPSPSAPPAPWVPGTKVTAEAAVPDRGAAPLPTAALPQPGSWPLVGRDAELAALTEALAAAGRGTPRFATLVGEPGIGKSRLGTELAIAARRTGDLVLVGRCSQDEGAPPLWPWVTILGGIGQELPSMGRQDDPGAGYRACDAVARSVLAAARDRTVLLALDDLHWADSASLRVLRIVVESAADERLLVVGTWRPRPEPAGALRELADAFARRHAERFDLVGLSAQQAASVVQAVTGRAPSADESRRLAERTDGNAFFVVEYARLARERGDLRQLLDGADPPAAVGDVVARRVELLPDDTRTALRVAAVAGREIELGVLAEALGRDEDDVLDLLDPALDAGLVLDTGVDQFRFSHALVRDTLEASVPASRRGRMHARLATVLTGRRDRETRAALHWSQAGPAYAAQAWQAALVAAQVARQVRAHDEEAALLDGALAAQAADPGSGPRDRLTILLLLTTAAKWAGNWPRLVAAVEEAVTLAREIGDVELLADAACATTVGVLWQSAPEGSTNALVVGALRQCLAQLPPADSARRCRTMLALANEDFFASAAAERRALVEQAVAMARRLHDPELLLDALLIGQNAQRTPDTLAMRDEYGREALAMAEGRPDRFRELVAAGMRLVVLSELGDPGRVARLSARVRQLATLVRVPFGLLLLEDVELPWLAMAGRFEECADRLQASLAIGGSVELDFDAVQWIHRAITIWAATDDGWRADPALGASSVPALEQLERERGQIGTIDWYTVLLLLRAGRRADAASYRAGTTIDPDIHPQYLLVYWACVAEAAVELGEPEACATAYERLAPYAGLSTCVMSSLAMGPVDAYLALAAAGVGDLALAARHAQDAEALCRDWALPVVGRWLSRHRERLGV